MGDLVTDSLGRTRHGFDEEEDRQVRETLLAVPAASQQAGDPAGGRSREVRRLTVRRPSDAEESHFPDRQPLIPFSKVVHHEFD